MDSLIFLQGVIDINGNIEIEDLPMIYRHYLDRQHHYKDVIIHSLEVNIPPLNIIS